MMEDVNTIPKKIACVGSSQCVFFSKKDLEIYIPSFERILECVGIVITLKDGSKFLYHKFRDDGRKRLPRILKAWGVNSKNVQSIQLFTGYPKYFFFPISGDIVKERITTYAEDGRVIGVRERDILHKENKHAPYSGLMFAPYPWFGKGPDIVHPYNMVILSPEDSKQHDINADLSLKKKKLKVFVTKTFEDESRVYSFSVNSINQSYCKKNERDTLLVLEKFFKDPDIESKVTFQYIPHDGFLMISDDRAFFEKYISEYYCWERLIPFESPYSSDAEENFYHPEDFDVRDMVAGRDIAFFNCGRNVPNYRFNIFHCDSVHFADGGVPIIRVTEIVRNEDGGKVPSNLLPDGRKILLMDDGSEVEVRHHNFYELKFPNDPKLKYCDDYYHPAACAEDDDEECLPKVRIRHRNGVRWDGEKILKSLSEPDKDVESLPNVFKDVNGLMQVATTSGLERPFVPDDELVLGGNVAKKSGDGKEGFAMQIKHARLEENAPSKTKSAKVALAELIKSRKSDNGLKKKNSAKSRPDSNFSI